MQISLEPTSAGVCGGGGGSQNFRKLRGKCEFFAQPLDKFPQYSLESFQGEERGGLSFEGLRNVRERVPRERLSVYRRQRNTK